MSRAIPLLLLASCLDVGQPLYDRLDTFPPSLLIDAQNPKIFFPDAGRAKVQPGQFIELTFSEEMDPNSLRPGILIRNNPEREELPLLIQAPPPAASPRRVTSADGGGPFPYTVRVASAEATFASGIYTMQLRTLLIDLAGNPIEEEMTGFFDVP